MEIKYIPVNIVNGYPDSVPAVTQWDRGQFLLISGVSLPNACEVLFKNSKSEELLMVAGIKENGKTAVQIPNSLLCEPHDITAYVVLRKDDSGRTVIKIDLTMNKRLPPEDIPTDPDDPHYINGLSELIETVSEASLQAESYSRLSKSYADVSSANSTEAAASAEKAAAESLRAMEFSADCERSRELAVGASERAFTSEENAAASAAEAEEAVAITTAQAEKAEQFAAAAQAAADTITPADEHYSPESWTAQSGKAVSEAAWETLCNATEYTDEQIKNQVPLFAAPPGSGSVGDYIGQLAASEDGKAFYLYGGYDQINMVHIWHPLWMDGDYLLKSDLLFDLDITSERPLSGRALASLSAETLEYRSQIEGGIYTVKAMLDFLDNERIRQDNRDSELDMNINTLLLNFENYGVKKSDICQSFDGESQNPQSGLAVTEAITAAVGSVDLALAKIEELQNSYIGGASV